MPETDDSQSHDSDVPVAPEEQVAESLKLHEAFKNVSTLSTAVAVWPTHPRLSAKSEFAYMAHVFQKTTHSYFAWTKRLITRVPYATAPNAAGAVRNRNVHLEHHRRRIRIQTHLHLLTSTHLGILQRPMKPHHPIHLTRIRQATPMMTSMSPSRKIMPTPAHSTQSAPSTSDAGTSVWIEKAPGLSPWNI